MKIDNNLNLLKVLACFAVVSLHVSAVCVESSQEINISYILYYLSTFAVPIFFMVNGALILKKPDITYKYVMKKIMSIFKIVVSWNLLLVISRFIVKNRLDNPIKVILNSLIQKGFFFQFWFFGSLIIIYITLPILKKILYEKNIIKFFIVILIITIGIDIFNMYRGINGLEIVKNLVPQTFRMWTWYLYFVLGHIIYMNKDNICKKISFKTNTVLLIIFSMICVIYEINMSNKILSLYAENYYDNILVIIQIGLLFSWILRINLNELTVKIVNLISPCIIGIYIFHISVMSILNVYNYENVIINTFFIILVFLISTFISYCISKIKFIKSTISL